MLFLKRKFSALIYLLDSLLFNYYVIFIIISTFIHWAYALHAIFYYCLYNYIGYRNLKQNLYDISTASLAFKSTGRASPSEHLLPN